MKHTEEMAKRRAGFEARRLELLAAGYSETQRVITIKQANLYALLTAGPLAVLCLLLYFGRWAFSFTFSLPLALLFLAGLIISIPLHELLHGLAWGLCNPQKFASIRFGIIREYLTPYCHCREPLTFGAYMLGGLTPLLVLGLGMFALAFTLGNGLYLALALFNIVAAGGDTTIACLLLRHRHAIMLDHPSECGFVAYQRAEDGKRR